MGFGQMEFRRYTPADSEAWNAFVARSKNGTFLFDRRYMDYHSDRFEDCSWMVYRKGRLFALLPGNKRGDAFCSHEGLTYGGFVTDERVTAGHLCECFETLNGVLRDEGFKRVVYKPVPWIYQQLPAEEDIYALYVRCRARLTERDASSTVFLKRRIRFAESRRSGIRKGERAGLEVCESDDVEAFWRILTDNLRDKYAARPVHTAAEMRLLKARFPECIRLFVVCREGEMLGGTVLYLTPQVVHTQYISASQEGRRVGALDVLFDRLINHAGFAQPYFDFGTSAQEDSNEVNSALIFQKHGFGGRCVCYDRYEYALCETI